MAVIYLSAGGEPDNFDKTGHVATERPAGNDPSSVSFRGFRFLISEDEESQKPFGSRARFLSSPWTVQSRASLGITAKGRLPRPTTILQGGTPRSAFGAKPLSFFRKAG
jgi:hypothetical protein